MKAEREKRATILTSEGEKQSQVLSAEGAAQSQLIRAEADAKATIIEADARATAIKTVFDALNSSNINENVLAYTYLQQIPQIANGTANKIWLMPVELSKSIEEISKAFTKKN
jgi:regulator of protease activity HflC (stomatin/prohibitin superfamily)